MKALVTGANGFVGAAVVRQLLEERGLSVRAMVRQDGDCRNLEGLDVETVTADLGELDTLAPALRGCSLLFHVAADYRLWVPQPESMYRTNVQGTEHLMRMALAQGVDRIVYTSSVATLGHHADGSPADEDTPSTLSDMPGHYKRSKFLAEQSVKAMVEKEQLPAVIVNPSTPVGPGDIKPTPTGQMIRDAAAGRIPAFVDTGMNIVHVEDVARGHVLAWQGGEIGQRYILGGENLTLQEILACIARHVGRPAPRVRLPYGLAMAIAVASEAFARVAPSRTPIATVDSVRMARHAMYFSSQKAIGRLGYAPRSAVQALEAAADWFRYGYSRS